MSKTANIALPENILLAYMRSFLRSEDPEKVTLAADLAYCAGCIVTLRSQGTSNDGSAPGTGVQETLMAIEAEIQTLKAQGEAEMATLDQVQQDIADESTLIDGVGTLVTGLKQQVADALSGAKLPQAVQDKVDAVFAGAEANKAKLTAALAANTGIPPAVVAAPPADGGTAAAPSVGGAASNKAGT